MKCWNILAFVFPTKTLVTIKSNYTLNQNLVRLCISFTSIRFKTKIFSFKSDSVEESKESKKLHPKFSFSFSIKTTGISDNCVGWSGFKRFFWCANNANLKEPKFRRTFSELGYNEAMQWAKKTQMKKEKGCCKGSRIAYNSINITSLLMKTYNLFHCFKKFQITFSKCT